MQVTVTFDPSDPDALTRIESMMTLFQKSAVVDIEPANKAELPAGVEARESTVADDLAPDKPDAAPTPYVEPKAMQKAKDLAKANGITWQKLHPGSGKGGMITQADVQRAIKGGPAPAKPDGKATPTFAEVRAALGQVVQDKGAPAATKILEAFGVEKVSALKEEQWPAAITAIAAAL